MRPFTSRFLRSALLAAFSPFAFAYADVPNELIYPTYEQMTKTLSSEALAATEELPLDVPPAIPAVELEASLGTSSEEPAPVLIAREAEPALGIPADPEVELMPLPAPPLNYDEGMVLPPPIPVKALDSLPPALPAPLSALPAPPSLPPAPGKPVATSQTTHAPADKRAFLTRKQIEAQRHGCAILADGPTISKAAPGGEDMVLTYTLSNGARCLSGAAPTVSWIDVVRANANSVLISVKPNTETQSRTGEVAVVTKNGTSTTFVITQPSNSGDPYGVLSDAELKARAMDKENAPDTPNSAAELPQIENSRTADSALNDSTPVVRERIQIQPQSAVTTAQASKVNASQATSNPGSIRVRVEETPAFAESETPANGEVIENPEAQPAKATALEPASSLIRTRIIQN